MTLADRMNGVPGRPGFIYGLAIRNADRSLTVDVHRLEGGRVGPIVATVTGRPGWQAIHEQARERIDETTREPV